jgi:flagellum-specific ATP synthase
MPAVTTPEHRGQASVARQLLAAHARSEDLVRIGAYKPGTDAELDRAMRAMPGLKHFLQQGSKEHVTMEQTIERLRTMEL